MASLETRVRGVVMAACALCGTASVARAQAPTATLVGSVRDSSGTPIPGVEVRVGGPTPVWTRTNDAGGFRLQNLPDGQASLTVRRMGFAPSRFDVKLRAGRTDSVVVALTAIALALPGVVVEDEYMARSRKVLAGFWERRSRGFGNFVTRDQIEQREAHDFVDIAHMVPSMEVVTRNGRKTLRFGRAKMGLDCPPQYFVDGMRIENGSPDEFLPADVEAVEFYSGPSTMPPQFAPRPYSYTCGAIVIWTRIPGA